MSLEPSQRSVSYAFKILLTILDTRNEALGILTVENEVVLQTWLLVILESLSNSVFERRTSTGSGLFAALGCGLVETLG